MKAAESQLDNLQKRMNQPQYETKVPEAVRQSNGERVRSKQKWGGGAFNKSLAPPIDTFSLLLTPKPKKQNKNKTKNSCASSSKRLRPSTRPFKSSRSSRKSPAECAPSASTLLSSATLCFFFCFFFKQNDQRRRSKQQQIKKLSIASFRFWLVVGCCDTDVVANRSAVH